MNKIIKGKKYNTDTAELVADRDFYDNGSWSSTDALYKKTTGEFFIYHKVSNRDLYDRTDYLLPISEDEAKEFCERNLDADDYEKWFGEVAE